MAKRRPNGEGSIRKRKDGRWEGRITIGYRADGKPIQRSIYAKTQGELLKKLHYEIERHRDFSLQHPKQKRLSGRLFCLEM